MLTGLDKLDQHLVEKIHAGFQEKDSIRKMLLFFEYLFHGVPWFIVAILGYFYGDQPTSLKSYILFKGLILDIIFIGSLKVVFRRQRPRLNNHQDMALGTNSGVDKFSFPSGHSSRAVLLGNVVYALINSGTGSSSDILLFLSLQLCSFLTCLSRLLLLRHHLTDVLVGALVGYLTYLLVFILP